MEKNYAHPSVILGSVFWVGFLKPAPGTWGSLAALPIIWFANILWGWQALLIVTLIFSAITVFTAPVYEKMFGEDPGSMVSDEVAGQAIPFLLITVMAHELSLLVVFLGFILFRLFDIVKPLGINYVEKFHDGWGILLDDILAGFYAFLCLKIVILAFL